MVARTNILQQCGFNNANIRDYRKTSEKPTAEPLTKALVATWDAETARMSNDFVTGALKEAQPRDKLKFVQGADPNNYSEARIRKPTQVNVGDTSGTAMMNVLQLLSGKKDSPIDVTPDRHKLEAMPLTIDGGCDGQDDE